MGDPGVTEMPCGTRITVRYIRLLLSGIIQRTEVGSVSVPDEMILRRVHGKDGFYRPGDGHRTLSHQYE